MDVNNLPKVTVAAPGQESNLWALNRKSITLLTAPPCYAATQQWSTKYCQKGQADRTVKNVKFRQ